MSGRRASNCPNCGAPVTFQYSSAVQTVCTFCKSILVRTDVDLTRVGQASDMPPDASPIQILTEGKYQGRAFTVLGRIKYQYELGTWNEWHIVFSDGFSAWLSDAQLEYAISWPVELKTGLPREADLRPGQTLVLDNEGYTLTVVTKASYVSVEGELPFEYWDKSISTFADFRTPDSRFATVDYSEQPALVFSGFAVPFEALELKNLREFEGWKVGE